MNIEQQRVPLREPNIEEKYKKLKKKYAGLSVEHQKLLS